MFIHLYNPNLTLEFTISELNSACTYSLSIDSPLFQVAEQIDINIGSVGMLGSVQFCLHYLCRKTHLQGVRGRQKERTKVERNCMQKGSLFFTRGNCRQVKEQGCLILHTFV